MFALKQRFNNVNIICYILKYLYVQISKEEDKQVSPVLIYWMLNPIRIKRVKRSLEFPGRDVSSPIKRAGEVGETLLFFLSPFFFFFLVVCCCFCCLIVLVKSWGEPGWQASWCRGVRGAQKRMLYIFSSTEGLVCRNWLASQIPRN